MQSPTFYARRSLELGSTFIYGVRISFESFSGVVKLAALAEIFVPPLPPTPEEPIPDALRRLIGKFDPVERDRRNHALRKAGEMPPKALSGHPAHPTYLTLGARPYSSLFHTNAPCCGNRFSIQAWGSGRGRDGLRRPPPAQIRASASTHTALTKDERRRSVAPDRGVELGAVESTFSRPG